MEKGKRTKIKDKRTKMQKSGLYFNYDLEYYFPGLGSWLLIPESFFPYIKKLIITPAATADPITPDTFGAIACINK